MLQGSLCIFMVSKSGVLCVLNCPDHPEGTLVRQESDADGSKMFTDCEDRWCSCAVVLVSNYKSQLPSGAQPLHCHRCEVVTVIDKV